MLAKQEWAQFTVARTPTKRNATSIPIGKNGKAAPAFGWKDSATIAMLMTMTKAMKVTTEEMMAGMTVTEVVEMTAAALVVVVMIATTVVIR